MASRTIVITAAATATIEHMPPTHVALCIDIDGAVEKYYAHPYRPGDKFEFHFQLPPGVNFMGWPVVLETQRRVDNGPTEPA